MIGCASCLCASNTQQHFASWRDAVSPKHRPSTKGLRANTAADASAWTTGDYDATTTHAANSCLHMDHKQPTLYPGARVFTSTVSFPFINFLLQGDTAGTQHVTGTVSNEATSDMGRED